MKRFTDLRETTVGAWPFLLLRGTNIHGQKPKALHPTIIVVRGKIIRKSANNLSSRWKARHGYKKQLLSLPVLPMKSCKSVEAPKCVWNPLQSAPSSPGHRLASIAQNASGWNWPRQVSPIALVRNLVETTAEFTPEQQTPAHFLKS